MSNLAVYEYTTFQIFPHFQYKNGLHSGTCIPKSICNDMGCTYKMQCVIFSVLGVVLVRMEGAS